MTRLTFKTKPEHTTWQAILEMWEEGERIEQFDGGWLFDHFYPIHGTTRQEPLAVFAAVEKSALGPLEGAKRFDPPTWQQCKVHPDHHFQFDKAIYCLPTEYIGRQLWIRADTKVVRAYCNGQLARSYQRLEPGGRYTDYDD